MTHKVFEELPIGAWFVVMGDETKEVLQKIEFVDGTAEAPLGYNARSLSGDHYWVVGRAVVEVREVGYVGELAEVDFTPPTKKELLDQWVIATNKAITALTDWRDTLTRWAADDESITDPTFMSAYGKLTNVVGYWADDALWDDYNIDRLREALTGVDSGDWGHYVDTDSYGPSDCAYESQVFYQVMEDGSISYGLSDCAYDDLANMGELSNA